MLCAFVGAGLGNTLRMKLIKHNYTLFLNVAASVSLACLVYALLFNFLETCFGIATQHEAGYICSMLFIIPGFPFITSGIDLAKLDLRSGIERLAYAIIIILAATLTAWDLCFSLTSSTCRLCETTHFNIHQITIKTINQFWRRIRILHYV